MRNSDQHHRRFHSLFHMRSTLISASHFPSQRVCLFNLCIMISRSQTTFEKWTPSHSFLFRCQTLRNTREPRPLRLTKDVECSLYFAQSLSGQRSETHRGTKRVCHKSERKQIPLSHPEKKVPPHPVAKFPFNVRSELRCWSFLYRDWSSKYSPSSERQRPKRSSVCHFDLQFYSIE